MHISKYENINKKAFKEAIEKIKSNHNQGFEWYVVRNSKGCLFEIGGRNINGKFDMKVYIPNYNEDGSPVFFKVNDFMSHNCSIEHFEEIDYSAIEMNSTHIRKKLFKDHNEFIKYVNKRDFIKNPIKIENKLARYEAIYEYDIVNF